jgi:hypothetical protein
MPILQASLLPWSPGVCQGKGNRSLGKDRQLTPVAADACSQQIQRKVQWGLCGIVLIVAGLCIILDKGLKM